MGFSTWSATGVNIAWVLVVVVYAGLASLWTSHDPGWYAGLHRPSFQPPDWVFGVIWPLNFLVLLVVGVVLPRTVDDVARTGPPLLLLAASVFAALLWAYLFYVPHRLVAAAACLAVAAVLTWVLVVVLARVAPWSGLVLVPYAVWLSVATALAVDYSRTTH